MRHVPIAGLYYKWSKENAPVTGWLTAPPDRTLQMGVGPAKIHMPSPIFVGFGRGAINPPFS